MPDVFEFHLERENWICVCICGMILVGLIPSDL